jgi:hypothetical protein
MTLAHVVSVVFGKLEIKKHSMCPLPTIQLEAIMKKEVVIKAHISPSS